MALVYVTDDEINICRLVAFGLKDEGFEAEIFTDGNALLEAVERRRPDAVTLGFWDDTTAPDGLAICRTLRSDSATRALPILMLTAKSSEIDRVLGLEMGADDYIVKPSA